MTLPKVPVSTPIIPMRPTIAKAITRSPFISVRFAGFTLLEALLRSVLEVLPVLARFDCIFCLPFFSSAILHSTFPFLSYTLALNYTIFTYESISKNLNISWYKYISREFILFRLFPIFPLFN